MHFANGASSGLMRLELDEAVPLPVVVHLAVPTVVEVDLVDVVSACHSIPVRRLVGAGGSSKAKLPMFLFILFCLCVS